MMYEGRRWRSTGKVSLPAMMGNGIKDDTMLHRSWRSGGFTVERSVVVDFKYALFTRSQAEIYKRAMKGAEAMIKEREVKEAIQIAAWVLCVCPTGDEDPVAIAVPARSSRAWQGPRVDKLLLGAGVVAQRMRPCSRYRVIVNVQYIVAVVDGR